MHYQEAFILSRGYGNTMEYLFTFICWTHWTRSEFAILLYRILWFLILPFKQSPSGHCPEVPGSRRGSHNVWGFLLWTDNTHQAFHDVMIGDVSPKMSGRPFFWASNDLLQTCDTTRYRFLEKLCPRLCISIITKTSLRESWTSIHSG